MADDVGVGREGRDDRDLLGARRVRDRLGRLFERALELDGERRGDLLAELVASEPEVAEELASLLEAHARSPDQLERLAEALLPAALAGLSVLGSPVGRRISHYRVEESIGVGGMGVVYRAHDLRLDRPVALKFLHPHLTADPGARASLESEARAASALDHPNIAVVYEIGTAEPDEIPTSATPRMFIAMAFYSGETIRQKLTRGPLSPRLALEYAIQVAGGLAAAHVSGIVHRDVKPANVIVTEQGLAKIVDFGIARSVREASGESAPTTRGTLAYMSPEQTRGDGVDERTDVWSLGVMLYEMLTGRRPFEGETETELIGAVRHGRPLPVPVPEGPRDLAAPLHAVIARCLEKDPDDRYDGAEALLADLRSAARMLDAGPSAGTRRRVALGAVALAVVAVLFPLWNGEGERASRGSIAERPRLAVLPFEGISADTADAFIDVALADELIGELGRFDGLLVRPIEAVRSYDGPAADTSTARALAADFLVTGEWQRYEDSIRLSLELTDGATGRAEAIPPLVVLEDRLAGLPRILAGRIASRLGVEAADETDRRIATLHVDPAAYHLYLRSLASPYPTRSGNLYAHDLLSRSVAIDSTFAPSQAALGCRSFALGNLGFAREDRERFWVMAENAFARALAIDTNERQALACGALLHMESGRTEQALELLRHALAVHPADADALLSLGHVYRQTGLAERSLETFSRAEALDPTNLRLANAGLGYQYAGRGEQALRLFDLDPSSVPSRVFTGLTLLDMGERERARESLAAAARLDDAGSMGRVAAAYVAWLDGERARGLEIVRELERATTMAGVSGEELYHYARLRAALGAPEAAVRLFGNAVDQGFFPVSYFRDDPFLDPLRGNEAFREALARARARSEAIRALVASSPPDLDISRSLDSSGSPYP